MQLLDRQVSGNLLQENFVFSNGWLEGFKIKHNLSMKTGHGEEGGVDMEFNRPLFEAIAQQLSGFALRDIYNCDETGLYLKVLSARTLAQGRVSGRKPDTDGRVSILLCCNADGSDKRKPFVLCKH